ncbi:MAG: AAA family ATPase [Gammaproteobacteria bacterium]|nr:AAA family ATPase [Gammaproteobacteria bacterium]
MAIVLTKLVSKGMNQPDADIDFRRSATLVRGPSDTGKSYIRDCLWYLLGGDKIPKEIPQSKGYDSLYLELNTAEGDVYTIRRSIFGGGAEVYPSGIQDIINEEPLLGEIGQLLVGLSGAKDKLILRTLSKRGPVTGGDLRHWCLLSQPTMISEESTTGTPTEKTQRKAAFYVFLTGQDDASFVLAQTKDEKIKLSTLIEAIERDLERVNFHLPKTDNRSEVQNALLKVDSTLDVLSKQQFERSLKLRTIRNSFNEIFSSLKNAESKLSQSMLMASRFTLLDEKYSNDLSRLRAIGDGIAVFETISSQPCLLCGTSVEEQVDMAIIASGTASKQRIAMEAEAKKIDSLRNGLKVSLDRENTLILEFTKEVEELEVEFSKVSKQEKTELFNSKSEFSADPKELAEARTEYVAQIKLFEEIDRLKAEHERVKGLLPAKKVKSPKRHADVDAVRIGEITKELLNSWGFNALKTVELIAEECDISIDGRPRLTYGAGKRAIFLSAMTVALMQHAMEQNYPHMGVVVLDSPIKSYSDPVNLSDITVSPVIVRDSFYHWLANWSGPGQVIVLENEPIKDDIATRLFPIEFTGIETEGRVGFYPYMNEK